MSLGDHDIEMEAGTGDPGTFVSDSRRGQVG